MKSIRLAFTFLTVVPMGTIDPTARDWHRAAIFFPLVGATLGAFLAICANVLLIIIPSPVVAALTLAGLFLLTRGLHIDGLSDSADGLLGGLDRERSLHIMRSGSAGPMGMSAVVLVLLIKYSVLVSAPESFVPMLFFAPLCGRWCMVVAGTVCTSARNEGLGSAFINGLNWPHLLWSTLLTSILFVSAVYVFGIVLPGLFGLLLALAVSGGLAAIATRRLGGVTGDILGAVNEIAEASFMVGFIILIGFLS